MLKVFLVVGLFISSLFVPIQGLAQAPHSQIAEETNIPADPAFDEIRIFYKDFKYARAAQLTKKLTRQRKNKVAAQAAAFLLGDLYVKIADKGEPKKYKDALNAYQAARQKYPNSEDAIVALWKIGSVYLKRQLHYEAIASFNRILKSYPEHPIATSAQLGKGQATTAINQMREAIGIFDAINPGLLSHTQRMILLLSYGDAFYKLDYLHTAYEYYKLVPIEDTIAHAKPLTFYQYGISALQAKDYKRAREIFSALGAVYPSEAEGIMGLVRIGDAWRMEGMSLRADAFYQEIANSKKPGVTFQKAQLAAAVGALHLAGCYPKPLLVRQSECDKIRALESEKGRDAEQKIKTISPRLIERIESDEQIESLLVEAVAALERHRAYTSSLWIKEKALERKISKKTREGFEETLQQTVIKSVEQLVKHQDNLEALNLFFRYHSFFLDGKVEPSIALRIGVNLSEAGFHEEAAILLGEIAEGKAGQIAKEAHYHLIKAKFDQGDFELTDRLLKRFIQSHPNSIQVPSLEHISAEILDKQGKHELALVQYQSWLKRYPKHAEKRKVQVLLARAYEKKGALKKAIAVYLDLNAGSKKEDPEINLHVADLYYRIKNYKAALPLYQKSMDALAPSPKKEWATLQLANTFERIGQGEKGGPLFSRLAREAKDDLIQGIAAQKVETIANP